MTIPWVVRFWAKVEKGPECWLWTAATSQKGYGRFDGAPSSSRMAHRVAWELAFGSVPDGLVIHHACANKLCVNPGHLVALTVGAHTLIEDNLATQNAAKTHCPQGHPYDAENTLIHRSGDRRCRTCHRLRERERRRRKATEHELAVIWPEFYTYRERCDP